MKRMKKVFISVLVMLTLVFGLTGCSGFDLNEFLKNVLSSGQQSSGNSGDSSNDSSSDSSNGGGNSGGDSSNDSGNSSDSTEAGTHTHVYDNETAEEKYLKENATCTSKAVYYKSCECGEKGTEIFEYGGFGHTDNNDGTCSVCRQKYYSVGLKYLEYDLSYLVSIGECTDTDIIIPHMYNNLPVTTINYNAFKDCTSLTSVKIPDSVTSIGAYAFYNCTSLTSIGIPDSVTLVGYEAFDNTGYYNDEQNWEDDVLYIGKYLIEAKNSLSGAYTIKDGTTLLLEDAFKNCSSLTSIKIPCSVTSIAWGAFSGCSSLTSVEIPDSVTLIDWYAFTGCSSLTSIEIPNSVTSIGLNAFFK